MQGRRLLITLAIIGLITIGFGCGERQPKWTVAVDYEPGTMFDGEGGNLAVVELCEGGGASVIQPSTVFTDEASYEIVLEVFADAVVGDAGLENGWIAVNLDLGAISVDEVVARAEELRLNGEMAMLNLVYFFTPQGRFYPVDEAKDASKAVRKHEVQPLVPDADYRVLTIDTGLPEGGIVGGFSMPLAGRFSNDGITTDGVTGHGPAIADLISHSAGWSGAAASDRSLLVQIDANQTFLADPGDGPIRAFTSTALISTLDAIDAAGLVEGPMIVNMSFGAKACPETFEVKEGDSIRIVDPVHEWILAHSINSGSPENFSVVASAGNYGLESRTYPAAFTDDAQIGANVVSVGALTPGGRRSCYSDWGSWVDVSVPGDEVVVDHPLRTDPQVWSGTSFAAPQVAGAMAAGLGIGQVPNANVSPSGPDSDEASQCKP